jgi:hypothetical protein
MPKKPVVRPNRGSALRPRAETPRRHFLYLDVTKEEQQKIRDYCVQQKISVSQFLADLVIKDATKSKPKRKENVTIRAEFEVTPEEYEKLELLLRLRQKDSIGQFVSELLRPNLEIQRLHSPVETTALRYYLSEDEHEIVTKHMASKGIAARNYGALLALKAIEKLQKKRK